jgi:hypothetical protein
MGRQPFVWEVHVRRDMVEDELSRLREIPYSVWRDVVGVARTKQVTGRDNRVYTVTVLADWARSQSEYITVTLTLSGGGLRRSRIQERFTISPEGQIG